MSRNGRRALSLALALSFAGAVGASLRASPQAPSATGAPVFERDIAPVLNARCVSCHGPEEQESFLRLDTPRRGPEGRPVGSRDRSR